MGDPCIFGCSLFSLALDYFCHIFRQTKATGAPAVTSAATRDNIKSTRENKDDKGENIHKEEAMEADISEPSLAVSAEPIPVVNTDQQHRHVFSYRYVHLLFS